jgi:hypothetical protein
LRNPDEVAVFNPEESVQASYAIAERIDKEAGLLSRFPRSSCIGRVTGTRERIVGGAPIFSFTESRPGGFVFSRSTTALANGPRVSEDFDAWETKNLNRLGPSIQFMF